MPGTTEFPLSRRIGHNSRELQESDGRSRTPKGRPKRASRLVQPIDNANDLRSLLPLPFEPVQSYHAYLTMANSKVQEEIRAFAACYREQVLTVKNRSVQLLGRKCEPELMYTFLGYEVKLGQLRVTCPDLVTARYLSLFGKLGLASIQIPYDPTVTSRILPLLETSLSTIDDLIEAAEPELAARQRRFRRIYAKVRSELSK